MKKLQVYLDTFVINFLFAEDAPEKRDITREFFEEYVAKKIFDVYVSPVVIDEINRTKDDTKKTNLLGAIRKFGLKVVDTQEITDSVQILAQKYIAEGVIPEKKMEDALHIAICTVLEMDVLLSWNYKHLANVDKEIRIQGVNLLEGFSKTFRMVTPMEVVYEDE